MKRPLVSCLCPTYGRYRHLRQALACFLAQDYEPKELVILNDHPTPIRCDYLNVRIVNVKERYEGMGRKRQALLDLAEGEWAAQWDDDDFYLPWHLSHWLPVLMAKGPGLLKPLRAFSSRGFGTDYAVIAYSGNAYQSQNLFDVATAQEVGYGTSWIRETVHQVVGFHKLGVYHPVEDAPWGSMIYGWADGTSHASAYREGRTTWERYAKVNQDVSDKGLTPSDITHQLRAYTAYVQEHLDVQEYAEPLRLAKQTISRKPWEGRT